VYFKQLFGNRKRLLSDIFNIVFWIGVFELETCQPGGIGLKFQQHAQNSEFADFLATS
jgi:hypothetical protein